MAEDAREGLNEALFRELNEKRRSEGDPYRSLRGGIAIVCECSNLDCSEEILMTPLAYEALRASAETFAVVPGHETPGLETVVAREDGYNVIRKTAGEAADLARETDPRS